MSVKNQPPSSASFWIFRGRPPKFPTFSILRYDRVWIFPGVRCGKMLKKNLWNLLVMIFSACFCPFLPAWIHPFPWLLYWSPRLARSLPERPFPLIISLAIRNKKKAGPKPLKTKMVPVGSLLGCSPTEFFNQQDSPQNRRKKKNFRSRLDGHHLLLLGLKRKRTKTDSDIHGSKHLLDKLIESWMVVTCRNIMYRIV